MTKITRAKKITPEYLDEIARLCAYSGMTYRDISRELGMADEYVSDLRGKHPYLKEKTEELTKQRFKEMSGIALNRLAELLAQEESPSVALGSVKEVLSRAGYDAKQVIEQTNKDITVELVNEDED